eukprot:scaffold74557_cov52-Phaeocystis_antarctica.AAC.1
MSYRRLPPRFCSVRFTAGAAATLDSSALPRHILVRHPSNACLAAPSLHHPSLHPSQYLSICLPPQSRPSSDRMAERIAWGLGFYRGHTGPRGKPGWISHEPNASAIEVEVDNVLPDIDPYSGTQLAPRRPTVLQLRASDAIA